MAKDVGKHFRQTPIELTRKILARKTREFSPDRHQQVPHNQHWQTETGTGKKDIGLIQEDIK